MKIAEALGLKGDEAIAFVGAGGKTTALFCIARELSPPVLVTTTTHLGAWQTAMADMHQVVTTLEEVQGLEKTSARVLLLTGPKTQDNRFSGLEKPLINAIWHGCQQNRIPLLIEADGAKQKDLKAPAEYEPVIPEWVDQVVVMAGLKGLGKPLDSMTVHRPEFFAKLSGLALGEQIGISDLVSVLSSLQGGLKDIPEGCRHHAFLTQAEDILLQSLGNRVARKLVAEYERVLVGSLKQPNLESPILSVHAQTAGILLAAGGSKRFGKAKQLLLWRGVPLVRRVAQAAFEAGLKPLIVVAGEEHDLIAKVLQDLPMIVIQNSCWVEGQSTSIQIGLDALPGDCESVMFLLSDQPQISSHLICQLLERYANQRAMITAPVVQGQRGNPVLFAREALHALRQITGDQGGRAIFNQFKVDLLPWIDTRLLMDVDEKGDLEKLTGAYTG